MTTQEHKTLESQIAAYEAGEKYWSDTFVEELIASRNELAAKLAEANNKVSVARITIAWYCCNDGYGPYAPGSTNFNEEALKTMKYINSESSRTSTPKPGEPPCLTD